MLQHYDNVLIGGSGFIGTALGEAMAKKGESVLSISRSIGKKYAGIDSLLLDVSEPESLSFSLPTCDNVFILIGQNSPHFSVDQELSNLKNIITLVNAVAPKKVFYMSSVLMYGERSTPAKEDDTPNPLDEYSSFKCLAEELLQHKLDPSIPLGIVRLANVYGSPKNRGFTDFIMRRVLSSNTQKISINGTGTQVRDYIFIDDVVLAILAVRDGLTASDTVNIATGNSYSLIELIERISEISATPLPYEINGKQILEVVQSRISNKKLKEQYGFTPIYSFSDGLRKTLRRYQMFYALRDKKIVLMGGEGFVGRNLSLYFSQHNSCVSIGSEKSIFPHTKDEFIKADPYQEELKLDYDVAIHLIDNKVPLEKLAEYEVLLVHNIKLNSKSHLILFSSSVIYASPDSEYAIRKKTLENFYVNYCGNHAIPLTIIRLFNTFGPFQLPYRKGSLAGNLIYNYLNTEVTEITNMDSQRDFVYSKDIAKFVEYVLLHKLEGVFDVGSGKLTSVKDLISLLQESVLREEIPVVDMRIDEHIVCPAANIDVFQSVDATSLEQGLKETVAFYRENLLIIQEYIDEEKN